MERILYFTDDFSQENQAYAKQHGLIIRNAKAYGTVDYLEQCDKVFGQVPKAYEHLPRFELDDAPDDDAPDGDVKPKLTRKPKEQAE